MNESRHIPINFIDAPVFKNSLMHKGQDGAFYRTDLSPGTARWVDGDFGTQLSYSCPCGCGCINQVPVHTETGYGWKWDGDRQKPTLTPSIAQTTACKWHGFLTGGVFQS
jgi:hypothetical protein